MTATRQLTIPRALRRAVWKRIAPVLGFILAAVAVPLAAYAQDSTLSSAYITPFPENDTYRLQVYGDSLAEGLTFGLNEAFGGDTRLQVQRGRHPIAGIFRNEFDDELRTIETNLSRVPMHVAVVMVGLYDRYAWRPQGMRRINTGSDEWKAEYGRRVDRLMKLLKTKGVALYWVGLPIMRRPEASDDAQMVNEIVRERALVNGQKFIDTFAQFSSETGTFSAYGPELDGKIRLLREADGAHFTPAGNRKLAHFVEREIRRDLSQARSERNIPLAGTEVEQKRIRQSRPPPPVASAPVAGAKGAPAAGKDAKIQSATVDNKPGTAVRTPPPADGSGPGDVKADNTRITLKGVGAGGKEESIAVEIVRPAIPASVLAVVTRRESSDRASQVGDSITSEIAGALTVISSVTLTSDAPGDRRRVPPTQTPYYRALVKGERLAPRLGRADDFSWPKPEPPPVDAAADGQSPASGVTLVPAKARRPASPSG
jgi:hypothetical protein